MGTFETLPWWKFHPSIPVNVIITWLKTPHVALLAEVASNVVSDRDPIRNEGWITAVVAAAAAAVARLETLWKVHVGNFQTGPRWLDYKLGTRPFKCGSLLFSFLFFFFLLLFAARAHTTDLQTCVKFTHVTYCKGMEEEEKKRNKKKKNVAELVSEIWGEIAARAA